MMLAPDPALPAEQHLRRRPPAGDAGGRAAKEMLLGMERRIRG